MKSYDWMVAYTPQTDWIKGHGIFVWLSFFTGILGGGAYLASLYFNSFAGIVVSWIIIAVLKGGLHVGHTKKPLKLWRMILKVRTSWIARGTLFTILTVILGAIQIILFSVAADSPAEIVFRILTGLSALAVMIYEGFTINYIKGIPFWNSSLLPPTLISWGILMGLALVTVISSTGTYMAEVISAYKIILIVTVVLTILYLWNALYAESASKESMREIIGNSLFWIGSVVIGFVVPAIVLFSINEQGTVSALVILISEIIGALAFTYCVFKAGFYRPLIGTHKSNRRQ